MCPVKYQRAERAHHPGYSLACPQGRGKSGRGGLSGAQERALTLTGVVLGMGGGGVRSSQVASEFLLQ